MAFPPLVAPDLTQGLIRAGRALVERLDQANIPVTAAAYEKNFAEGLSAASALRRSRSRTTTSRLGSAFFELPVIRAAWRMRRSESSGRGVGRKTRWSRLSTTAR